MPMPVGVLTTMSVSMPVIVIMPVIVAVRSMGVGTTARATVWPVLMSIRIVVSLRMLFLDILDFLLVRAAGDKRQGQ